MRKIQPQSISKTLMMAILSLIATVDFMTNNPAWSQDQGNNQNQKLKLPKHFVPADDHEKIKVEVKYNDGNFEFPVDLEQIAASDYTKVKINETKVTDQPWKDTDDICRSNQEIFVGKVTSLIPWKSPDQIYDLFFNDEFMKLAVKKTKLNRYDDHTFGLSKSLKVRLPVVKLKVTLAKGEVKVDVNQFNQEQISKGEIPEVAKKFLALNNDIATQPEKLIVLNLTGSAILNKGKILMYLYPTQEGDTLLVSYQLMDISSIFNTAIKTFRMTVDNLVPKILSKYLPKLLRRIRNFERSESRLETDQLSDGEDESLKI